MGARHAPEVFWRFLLLGCSSFGGPAAHLGYFRATFVERLGWLDDAAYGRLVGLSQFLPGPGSSQVGFAIGLGRAGLAGGLAAFLGFTLPSFLLMGSLAALGFSAEPGSAAHGLVAGLKLLAVVVVADAVRGMYASFCTTRLAAGLAIASAAVLLAMSAPALQFAVLLSAAVIAALAHGAMPVAPSTAPGTGGRIGWGALLLAAMGLGLLLPLGSADPRLALAGDFYGAGALVFGGGHVVLPLLQDSVGTALGPETFLTGYAAAQALPGPMFTLAAHLGGALLPTAPWLGASIATAAIFAPGLLLVLALKDSYATLLARPRLAAAASGINAAVVGLLLAALYQPVFTAAVSTGLDLALAVVGFWVLVTFRPPILLLVAAFAASGVLRLLL
jgi:chromate transporter